MIFKINIFYKIVHFNTKKQTNLMHVCCISPQEQYTVLFQSSTNFLKKISVLEW
jgi:hypothetical protein